MTFFKPQTESNLIESHTEDITYCSFSSLLKQNAQAQLLSKKGKYFHSQHKSIHAPQIGQHLSTFKGQGMDFAESRIYQSGDDIRHIDWRVTARTGKTYTKVYTEQRERPVMLIVDMRKPMFFGTKNCYKSVLAARIASLIAWKNLNNHDKTGIIIIPSSEVLQVQKPAHNQNSTAYIIKLLAKATQSVNRSNSNTIAKGSFISLLKQIRKYIKAGTHVIMLSDFRGVNQDSVQLLTSLSRKSSLHLFSISDPFEESLLCNSEDISHSRNITSPLFPSKLLNKLPLINGKKRIWLNHQAQLKYSHLYQSRQYCLQQLSQQNNIQLLEFSTTDSSSHILTKLARVL